MSRAVLPWVARRALAALLWGSLATAQADTVYRCASGSYSQQPCAQGHAIEVDDARTAAQRREAAEAARRDAELAQQLAHEREAREAAPGANAVAIGSVPKPAHAPTPAHKKVHSHRHKHHARRPGTDGVADDSLSAPVRVPGPAPAH